MITRFLTVEPSPEPPRSAGPLLKVRGSTGQPLGAPRTLTPTTVNENRWRPAQGDAAVSLLVLFIVNVSWPAPDWIDGGALWRHMAVAATLWVVLESTVLARGAYARVRCLVTPRVGSVGSLAGAAVSTMILALAAQDILPPRFQLDTSAAPAAAALGACVLAVPAGRAFSHRRTRQGRGRRRVLMVGTGMVARDAAVRVSRQRHLELVGFIGDTSHGHYPVLGDLDSLPRVCQEIQIDDVLVATSAGEVGPSEASLAALSESIGVHVVPAYMEVSGWRPTIEDLGGIAVVTAADPRGGTPLGKLMKRVIDAAVAACGLILLTPLLIATGVVVRLTSPGPALFRQVRIGIDRRPFVMVKFRTMRPLGGSPDLLATPSRVTGVGRLLRRTGIDEVPQLINVLLGHMSLVGPRPLIPQESDLLPHSAERRFEVRPGMTGLWQICGQHDLRWDEMCRLDTTYVATWSFRSDLRILMETPKRLWRGGGIIGVRWNVPSRPAD